MACREFTVLYTHQKTKKSKIWQDGFLRMCPEGNKANLFDDKGQRLESVFLKVGKIHLGEDLESDRYLITVEAEKAVENGLRDQFGKQEALISNRSGLKPTSHFQPRLPAGLKRKSTGFHGPRSIACKAPEQDNVSSSSPPTKRPCSAFPSQFYTTSPLFSATYGNNVKTNLLEDSKGGVPKLAALPDEGCGLSLSSLLSPAYIGSVERVKLEGKHCISDASATNAGQAKSPAIITLQTKDACKPSGGRAVPQNIRSKAQILALLKSKPQSLGAEVNTSEISSSFSKHTGTSTAFHSNILAGESKENMQQEHPHGDFLVKSVGNKSKWNVYLRQSATESSCKNDNLTVLEETNKDQGNCLDGKLPGSCIGEDIQHYTGPCQPFNMFVEDDGDRLVYNNHMQSCKDANLSHLQSASSIGVCKASMLSDCSDIFGNREEEKNQAELNIQTKLKTPSVSDIEVFNHEGTHKKEFNTFVNICQNVNDTRVPDDLTGVGACTSTEEYGGDDAPSDNRHMPRIDSESVYSGRKPSDGSAGLPMKEECITRDDFSDPDEFSEITFNLLDNFDFDATEEEDSQESSRPAHSSVGMLSKSKELTGVGDAEEMRPGQGKDCFTKSLSFSEKVIVDSVSGQPINEEILPSPHNAETSVGVGGSTKENEGSLVHLPLLGTGNFAQKTNIVNIQITNDKDNSEDQSVFGVDNSLSVGDGHYRNSVYTGRTEYEFEESKEVERISCSPMLTNTSTLYQVSEEEDALVNSNNPFKDSLWNSSECNVVTADNSVMEVPLEAKDPDSFCRHIKVKPDIASTMLNKNEKSPLVSKTSKLALARGHVLPNEADDWADASISPVLPDLGSGITLLRSLAVHSTALESLKLLEEENIGVMSEKRSIGSNCDQARDMEAESPENLVYSPEGMQTSSCLYSTSSDLKSIIVPEKEYDTFCSPTRPSKPFQPVEFQGYKVKGSASSAEMIRVPAQDLGWNQYLEIDQNSSFTLDKRFLSPGRYMRSDLMQSPDTESNPEDRLCFSSEENFQNVPEHTEEQISSASSLSFKTPPWILTSSSQDCDLELTQWPSCEPSKELSPAHRRLPQSPDVHLFLRARNQDITTDGEEQELLNSKVSSSDLESSECFFKTKAFRKLEDNSNISRLHPRFRTLVPIITAPSADGLNGITSCPDVDFLHENQIYPCPLESNLYGQPVVHPVSLAMLEDREDKVASLFVEDTMVGPVELGQTESVDVTAGPRQSKWLKYQSTAQPNSVAQRRDKRDMTDGACAENVFGIQRNEIREREGQAGNESPPESVHLKIIKDRLGEQHGLFSSQDFVSRNEILSLNSKQPNAFNKTQPVLSKMTHYSVTGDNQNICISELSFPSETTVKNVSLPKRQVLIPATFQSPAHYKQVFVAALTEHLNILLFNMSQRFHKALAKADLSFYTSAKEAQRTGKESFAPFCLHNQPAKLIMVKKEGPNKGRFFFTCDAPKANQCKFFKWLDEVKSSNSMPGESTTKVVLCDIKSVGAYIRCQRIFLYEECQLLVRKPFDFQRQFGKYRKNMKVESEFAEGSKSKLYLKLSKKENSSVYSKDDLWVVSKTLNFDPLDTFIACSAFFGPSAISELELLPLKGYYPSNWGGNMIVHALLVCNASTELTTLRNIQEHFNPATLPLMPYLLKMSADKEDVGKVSRRKFIPPAMSINIARQSGLLSSDTMLGLAEEMMHVFHLNSDQAAALVRIGQMMTSPRSASALEGQAVLPITVLHGVFGAGKSYLLAVVVLFLVQLFECSEAAEGPRQTPWKLLISSSTNVAVDRVLLGLLDLGFDKFIRVGSIRKIAKPILPYSLHAGSGSDNEQLKELLALMKEDLTPAEKVHVRKSIEQHKVGTNKQLLGQVRVVGVTCAACPFPCLNNLRFPVVVLDECSQITEPACLLPIARFECEKLVLVGDPKQLPPTIQGSECAHEKGLEQTLFDRLCLMGHEAVMLRTQYRCHPAISAIVNDLFYEGCLVDGISGSDRSPLLKWLPTLCFYNVKGTEQIEQDNSFHNMEEATFSCKLIQTLIASGIEGSMIGVITLYRSQMYKLDLQLGKTPSSRGQDRTDLHTSYSFVVYSAVQLSTAILFK